MRTTFLSQGRFILEHLRAAQARKEKANLEISSGLRVSKPSDSPADAAGIVRTRTDLRVIEQFRSNLESLQGELKSVDGALSQAGGVLNRAAVLATQAANEAQDNVEGSRESIRKEMQVIFRHLVSIANTSHAGRFVFAGSTDNVVPFVADPASPDGVVYQGDSKSRQIIFPDGRPAQVSLPGNSVFAQPDFLLGAGRTPGTVGATIPNPPVGIGLAFSGGLDKVLSVDLDGFFVASSAPLVPAGGETISVTFVANDGSLSRTVTTAPLSGGEDTLQIAAALNAAVAADPQLAGGFTFSSADGTPGGALKLVESDTLGVGFSFTSSATGGLTTGLEPGGTVGGQSAEEIAAALNAAVIADPQLTTANVQFTPVDGEVQVDADVNFTLTAVDFGRGTGFASGLAGTHLIGGSRDTNVFGALNQLIEDLQNNNREGIQAGSVAMRGAVEHISGALSFYGSTLRQVELTLDNLEQLDVVNQQRLSEHRDADLVDSIGDLMLSSSAEEFALQVAARRQPNLLDLLA